MSKVLTDSPIRSVTPAEKRVGVYLEPEDQETARQLAALYQGGNLSRLIRRLIRNAQENPDLAKERAA